MDADGHSTTTQDARTADARIGTLRPAEIRLSPDARQLISIYLADHHAGSTAGFELAKRAARHNAGTRIGVALDDIVHEIAADRRALELLMQTLDAHPSAAKRAGAFLGERIARLKTNGRLFSYSPLSRVLELEGLALGILGKLALWEGLAGVPALQGAAGLDFTDLANRARSQHDAVEECRRQAVELAFAA
jgi:hypothetical protein